MGENQTTNRAVSDVVFDFCGVLIDWQCHAALDGVYPEQLVADICADNDPYGFFHYEDLMDGGADFAPSTLRCVSSKNTVVCGSRLKRDCASS